MVSKLSASKKFDTLVVLGKNHNIGWGKEKIARDKYNLSPYSKMNVLAAGALYVRGFTSTIIFSGGATSGEDILSEAEAMKIYLRTRFSNHMIPDKKIILEARSINTKENAKYTGLIVNEYKFKRIGLLTLGFHSSRAEKFFKNEGMKVTVLHAEEIIREYVKSYTPYVTRHLRTQTVRFEVVKEKVLGNIIKVDRNNYLFGALTRLTRSGA